MSSPFLGMNPLVGKNFGDYRILISRGDQRPVADLYALQRQYFEEFFQVAQVLPIGCAKSLREFWFPPQFRNHSMMKIVKWSND